MVSPFHCISDKQFAALQELGLRQFESLFALSVLDCFGYYSISGIIYTVRVQQLPWITVLMATLLRISPDPNRLLWYRLEKALPTEELYTV